MKNTETKINTSQTSANTLLKAGDSGFIFTASTILSLVTSIIFSAVIYAIAASRGMQLTDYTKELENKFIYYLLSYGLGSVSVLATIGVFSVYKKTRPFYPLPFKKFRWKYLLIAVIISFGLIFGFTELNNLFLALLEKIGYSKPDMTLPNDQWWQLIVWLLVAAALPAFMEECLFRGYILEGMKGFSTAFIVVMGGILFSIFHQNPQQTPYQFICGAAFCLIALKSGSVWPSVIMHFLNNAVILISDYFKWQFGNITFLILAIVGLLLFFGGMGYLIFFDKNSDGEAEANLRSPLNPTKKPFYLYGAIGMIGCVVMWLLDLITYCRGA